MAERCALDDDPDISAQETSELAFHITDDFERDLKRFSQTERDLIADRINFYCEHLINDKRFFYQNTYVSRLIRLQGDFDSSLYILRLNPEIRVVLSVDDDPIFGQIIVTLFRVVKRKNIDKAFNSVAETLYKGSLKDSTIHA